MPNFYSAKANGLVNKLDQGIALVLYLVSFTCCCDCIEVYASWDFICALVWLGVIATAALAKVYLGQHIDLAGWVGIGLSLSD